MFVTNQFWILAIGALLLHNVTRGRLQNAALLFSSYIIYAAFDVRFLIVLIAATTITYAIGRGLAPSAPIGRRRIFLILGILFNLGVLGYFKYASFFADSFQNIFNLPAQSAPSDVVTMVILPLGISFYTFRLLSYLFDVNNKRIAPNESLVHMALYVSFFPQIAAGPIERATNFYPRLKETRRLTEKQLMTGVSYLFIGLFYKVAIADPLVMATENAFKNVFLLSAPDALTTLITYSLRIYADFAGYSALAIGVSTFFGLPAMENFRQPYFSQGIVEFWTRWHISLSSWFRDYLFFPISRALAKRFGRQHIFEIEVGTLFFVMLMTGLWHGANWTFVIWGGLHGIYVVAERLAARFRGPITDEIGRWRRYLVTWNNILFTNILVAFAWIFFRSPDLQSAIMFFQHLFTPFYSVDDLWLRRLLFPVILLVLFDLLLSRVHLAARFWELRLVWRVALLAIMILMLFILGDSTHELFIYSGF